MVAPPSGQSFPLQGVSMLLKSFTHVGGHLGGDRREQMTVLDRPSVLKPGSALTSSGTLYKPRSPCHHHCPTHERVADSLLLGLV